jgi:phosphopentomutase
MARAFLLVMDSVGIGNAPDAAEFGDQGANTLGHIAKKCALGDCDVPGGRSGPLNVPFLEQLGLGFAAELACGELPAGMSNCHQVVGQWGCAREISTGKDTISGHWEMTGVPVDFDWGYFTDKENSFPPELLEKLIERGRLPGILGNKHSSGPAIIAELGEEHIKTGKPICYTSADSVFQIAAHEKHFGLERLLDLCVTARQLLDPLNIGRVIARPFVGKSSQDFTRTANRHDYAVPPTGKTLLDIVETAGGAVHAVGKVSDIFAGVGVTRKLRASGHDDLMATTIEAGKVAKDGDLIFTNFVDFDMLYGHMRDVAGYAAALEYFDRQLSEFARHLKESDVVIVAADHGNDPTWKGNDHTREQVPVLMFGHKVKPGSIGKRKTFADIGATIAKHLGTGAVKTGQSFL